MTQTVYTITSMTRQRYEELRTKILDKSLISEYLDKQNRGVKFEDLTRKEQVLFRQMNAILNLVDNDQKAVNQLTNSKWKEVFFRYRLVDGEKMYSVEVVQ